MSTQNEIYLRRRNKIVLSPYVNKSAFSPLSHSAIGALLKNLESLGYTLSQGLIYQFQALTMDRLESEYLALSSTLRRLKGGHRAFRPMYPNFPQQVMEASAGELYINAIIHYLTEGQLLPVSERKERMPLLDNVDLKVIDLGTIEEFNGLFGQIVGSNTSLSEQDVQDVEWFFKNYGDSVTTLMPDQIPQKEVIATLSNLFMKHTQPACWGVMDKYVRTATDVLRVAVGMCGGDVSLAANTKFRSFKRKERRFLVGLLDKTSNTLEDMARHQEQWKRLGHGLHIGEYAGVYPNAASAIMAIRAGGSMNTTATKIEMALSNGNVPQAVEHLVRRPGDFARRLDHLLRSASKVQQRHVLEYFAGVADQVSTPVLLQALAHFRHRTARTDKYSKADAELRVFFPKGSIAKAVGIENNLPELSLPVTQEVWRICTATLVKRFSEQDKLGNVYIDPALNNYLLPFSQRSASKALRTIVRGSKIALPEGDTLRFFLWWKDGKDRTDIDLSAVIFDTEMKHLGQVAYYNLATYGGYHSGDIVSAPRGASEFIDISISKLVEAGARYIVMSLNSYTHQPYCDLPECFAGWMMRQSPNSGEIYDPKTVQDRIDLTADSQIAIPVMFDLFTREAIWCDLSLKRHPLWNNNVHSNMSGIQLTLKSMTSLKKPTVGELLHLHVEGRGRLVSSPTQADIVFSVANETPYQLETLASQYMA
jgi:hypothetical protein